MGYCEASDPVSAAMAIEIANENLCELALDLEGQPWTETRAWLSAVALVCARGWDEEAGGIIDKADPIQRGLAYLVADQPEQVSRAAAVCLDRGLSYDAGYFYAIAGDRERALEVIGGITARAPLSLARKALALSLVEPDQAARLLQEVPPSVPDCWLAYEELCYAYIETNRKESAYFLEQYLYWASWAEKARILFAIDGYQPDLLALETAERIIENHHVPIQVKGKLEVARVGALANRKNYSDAIVNTVRKVKQPPYKILAWTGIKRAATHHIQGGQALQRSFYLTGKMTHA